MVIKGPSLKRGWLVGLISYLSWSCIFAVIYGQSPLYTSNQHQYFLHGLARAGYGYLGNDWLANTIDPLPIFSGIVFITFRLFQTCIPFYLYYALLMGVYSVGVLGIMDVVFDLSRVKTHKLVFLTLFLTLHSAALRFLFSRVAGVADPFLLEGGVAGQRLLGQVIQPSSFGVFLILSIYLFLRGQPYLSLLSLGVAIYFHPVYLLSGALLVLGYMWVILREKKSAAQALTLGMVALIIVSPSLVYTIHIFRPSSSHVITLVNDLLVHFRNPHHAIVSEWLDWTVAVKATIVFVAALIVRRTRLFPILGIMVLGSILLTIVQLITDSNWIALVYPWRASVVFVPLSSCVVLAYFITKVLDFSKSHSSKLTQWTGIAAIFVLTGLIIIGVARFQMETARKQADKSRSMLEYVTAHKSPDDTYLVPTKMEEFRLMTGAPIFIDFKSVPYRDTDVLEWFERVRMAGWLYRDRVEDVNCDLLHRFRDEYAVTHVVLDEDLLDLSCPGLGEEMFRDEYYAVFRIDTY